MWPPDCSYRTNQIGQEIGKGDKDAGQRTPGGVATRDPEASATEPHQKNLGCGLPTVAIELITQDSKRKLASVVAGRPSASPLRGYAPACQQQRHKRGEKRSYNNYREFRLSLTKPNA